MNSESKLNEVPSVQAMEQVFVRSGALSDDAQTIIEEQPSKLYQRKVYIKLNDNEEEHKSYRMNVQVGEKLDIHVFPSNITRSALYTRFDLFPKAFFLQFTKLANVYWAICACL